MHTCASASPCPSIATEVTSRRRRPKVRALSPWRRHFSVSVSRPMSGPGIMTSHGAHPLGPHTHAPARAPTRAYKRAHTRARTCARACARTRTRVRARTHTHTHTRTCACRCACLHVYMSARVHVVRARMRACARMSYPRRGRRPRHRINARVTILPKQTACDRTARIRWLFFDPEKQVATRWVMQRTSRDAANT